MKPEYFMMSLLIPGPKSPGNDIDVYLRPLVDELNELWTDGVQTYDASTKGQFRLHAAVIWTINDFPAYANLSGWSTKGKLACPTCNKDTTSLYLKHSRKICYMGHRSFLPIHHRWKKDIINFDGKTNNKRPPDELTVNEIMQQLNKLPLLRHGKNYPGHKRKRDENELNWTKKSIFL